MKNFRIGNAGGILIGIVLAIGMLICIQKADSTAFSGTKNSTTRFGDLEALGDFRTDQNMYQSQEYNQTASTVLLTSPTATFDATDKGLVFLNSSASALAGVRPTYGSVGQIITIISGSANSNTFVVTDATSTTVGSSRTLTGQQNDVISLQCVSLSVSGINNVWAQLAYSDN